jgi:hypothetical protein
MSTLPTVLCTIGGAVLVALALRDVFDVLFHESGRGVLAHVLMRGVWRAVRAVAKRQPNALSLAGPLALLAVVATWAVLLVVGWALIYWPRMPGSFHLASGVDPGAPLLDSIYPVLSRRRSLAYEITLLVDAQESVGTSLLDLEPASAEGIYSELTSRLVAVERDMATFPVAYYFSTADPRFSFPEALPALRDMAERGADGSVPERVRLRATMLLRAIDDFAKALRGFHGREEGSTRDLIEAYRDDHLR